MAAARMLRRRGLAATLCIITGAVGTPGYVTRSDLHQLAADGDEIGGHTVSHLRLTALSTAEARRQVCESRSTWPGGDTRRPPSPTRAGRTASGPRPSSAAAAITGPEGGGTARPRVPGMSRHREHPAPQPHGLRTAGKVDSPGTPPDLEQTVIAAEQQGGWLPLVFHRRVRRPRLRRPGRARHDAGRLRPLARRAAAAGHGGPGPWSQVIGGPGPAGAGRRRRPLRTGPSTPRWSRSPLRRRSASLDTHPPRPRHHPPVLDGGWLRAQHRPLAADHGQLYRAVGSAAHHHALPQR